MELLCCTRRTRQPSLFPTTRQFSVAGQDQVEAEAGISTNSRFSSKVPKFQGAAEAGALSPSASSASQQASLAPTVAPPSAAAAVAAAADSSSEDEKADQTPLQRFAGFGKQVVTMLDVTGRFRGRNESSPTAETTFDDVESSHEGASADPFLLEDAAFASMSEAAKLERLKELALQLRGPITLRRRSSARHPSIFPPAAPNELHVELMPSGNGSGLEPWGAAELVFWESERASALATSAPIASARLLRILKAKHLPNHEGGRALLLRLQHPGTKEVCEEVLVSATPSLADTRVKALVECVNLVRLSSGRRLSARAATAAGAGSGGAGEAAEAALPPV